MQCRRGCPKCGHYFTNVFPSPLLLNHHQGDHDQSWWLHWILRDLLPKNLKNVANGGRAPTLVVSTLTICGPYTKFWIHSFSSSDSFSDCMALRLSWTKCVNMVCAVTPTVISPSSAYIAFLHKNKNNSSLTHEHIDPRSHERHVKYVNLKAAWRPSGYIYYIHP